MLPYRLGGPLTYFVAVGGLACTGVAACPTSKAGKSGLGSTPSRSCQTTSTPIDGATSTTACTSASKESNFGCAFLPFTFRALTVELGGKAGARYILSGLPITVSLMCSIPVCLVTSPDTHDWPMRYISNFSQGQWTGMCG